MCNLLPPFPENARLVSEGLDWVEAVGRRLDGEDLLTFPKHGLQFQIAMVHDIKWPQLTRNCTVRLV